MRDKFNPEDEALGFTGQGLMDTVTEPDLNTLAGRFIIPPFTVLNAQSGEWQKRKRAWLALGIESELGRGDDILYSAPQVTTENLNYYRNRKHVTVPKRDGALFKREGKYEPKRRTRYGGKRD
jgi:hypothetical protein